VGCADAATPERTDAAAGGARRPVTTYSIVARDARTGELGVAVQSHWFSVGPIVPWAQAGVGAVATQSFVKVSYGPDGLLRMAAGEAPADALAALLGQDDGRDVRQVAMIDAQGRVAAHTGARCIAAAGHATGEDFSVQANLMERDTVWPAMAAAFRSAQGPLAERMLAALAAAEAEGGDIRGRQSAALLVVSGTPTGLAWEGRLVDLRVEDHHDPLVELARLLRLHRAYDHMNVGDVHMEHGDVEAAVGAYGDALALAPEVHEIAFWSGITLASVGRADEALPLLGRAYAGEPRLRELVRRLPASGLLPDDEALIARLAEAGAANGAASGADGRRQDR
jgi:uncharacterized Ntn-hydrolase superfamily protein